VTAPPDLETFSPCVGERFAVEAAGREGETALELVEAKALPPRPGTPREQPFLLLFRGPADGGLGQGMVRLSHPRTGPVELFVVPVLDRDDGAYYEAVFG
jgi:hypothetical protein